MTNLQYCYGVYDNVAPSIFTRKTKYKIDMYKYDICKINWMGMLCAGLLFSCGNRNSSSGIGGFAKIHTIYELNKQVEAVDSHAGEEASSVLEMDFSAYMLIDSATLGVHNPVYSRIKKLKNGGYLLLYQDGRIADNIYYALSKNLKNWSQGRMLFEAKPIETALGEDMRKFSSADAAVLSNGDIVSVVSFRAANGYKTLAAANGIMLRRSKDNGISWGPEQVIYVGTNWEPYILELPTGELQCYFTDTDPIYRNSGTSMVVSSDDGETWTPSGQGNSYKVIRQYKYINNGKRIYTDQMPCIRVLNDGKTLVGFMEARLELDGPPVDKTAKYDSKYMMSLVYANNNWTTLRGDEVGPTDRQSNLFIGAGGYLSQFRSGETVISCNINRKFSMKLGDSKARIFNQSSWSTNWMQPFPESGYWGSTELDDAHFIIGTMHTQKGIMIGRFFLNHRIDAAKQPIKVDGFNADWRPMDALFIGSESETQASFRAAVDDENLYLLVERLDRDLEIGDEVDLYIHNNHGNTLNENSMKITIGPKGIVGYAKWVGSDWQKADGSSLLVANKVAGVVGDAKTDTGYLSEIQIPFSAINVKSNYLRFNAVLRDGDMRDGFTFALLEKPQSWMLIKK